jgi:hypothetical protein
MNGLCIAVAWIHPTYNIHSQTSTDVGEYNQLVWFALWERIPSGRDLWPWLNPARCKTDMLETLFQPTG